MIRKALLTSFVLILLIAASAAFAGEVLVSESPWGSNQDVNNMNDVFGAGNFTTYSSYSTANPASIFTAANSFVWLEGGAASDTDWNNYIASNSATILNWVNAGGSLLVMSAGWDGYTTTLGPGTLTMATDYSTASYCGTLTAAGQAAFPGTPVTQCGSWLSHDVVSGATLTDFMDGSAGPIIEGITYGAGYLMFAGLTDSQYHDSGASLVDGVVAYTAGESHSQVIPEPGSMALLGTGFAGIVALMIRRRRI